MNMIKIGKFLAELRRENNLTQEQLGEEIGVTNKTISRWETGNYLPPVEMLQMLSKKYGVTINELLCGERLDDSVYKEKAEETIFSVLSSSVFTVKDQAEYFKKKWLREHCFEMVIGVLVYIGFLVAGIVLGEGLFIIVGTFLALVGFAVMRNRMMSYIEGHIYTSAKFENTSDKKV